MQRLFSHLGVDCVIDVGANTGQYRDFLRDDVCYRGRVESFEPIPDHVTATGSRGARDPLWEVRGEALGSAPGTASFNIIMTGTQFSSFLAPDHPNVKLSRSQNATKRTIEVPVRTVDAVVDERQQRW